MLHILEKCPQLCSAPVVWILQTSCTCIVWLLAYVMATYWQVVQLTEVHFRLVLFVCVSRCPMDVHRTEPPLQTRAEVVVAAPAAQMEQCGRLPLGGW